MPQHTDPESKPQFDPSAPFEGVKDKPAFDPNAPFKAAEEQAPVDAPIGETLKKKDFTQPTQGVPTELESTTPESGRDLLRDSSQEKEAKVAKAQKGAALESKLGEWVTEKESIEDRLTFNLKEIDKLEG